MIKIFAVFEDNRRQEIADLYWFEENFVHTFANPGRYSGVDHFEFEMPGLIYSTRDTNKEKDT